MTLSLQPRPDWLAPLEDPRNETILSAAFNVFLEKGIHGATMLEIASRAHVSKETLYARFDSKEGLFYALVAWGARQSHQKPFDYDDARLEDPVAALKDYAEETMTIVLKPEVVGTMRIVIGEAERTPDIVQFYEESTATIGAEVVRRIAAALHARGLADIPSADDFASDFAGMLKGDLLHAALLGLRAAPTPAEIRAHAHRVVDRVLRAYAPR